MSHEGKRNKIKKSTRFYREIQHREDNHKKRSTRLCKVYEQNKCKEVSLAKNLRTAHEALKAQTDSLKLI
jgi:hypothetical protein